MRSVLNIGLFLLAALGLASVASAEEKKTAAKDPDRIICEKQEVVGSRLATRRVCMTAAQWEERKREDRQAIDKAQVQARGPSGS